MNFRDTIFEIGGGDALLPLPYRATLYGRAAYLENIKGLFSYEPDKIVLLLKRGRLTLEGEGLSIDRYVSGDMVVLGAIRKFEVEPL